SEGPHPGGRQAPRAGARDQRGQAGRRRADPADQRPGSSTFYPGFERGAGYCRRGRKRPVLARRPIAAVLGGDIMAEERLDLTDEVEEVIEEGDELPQPEVAKIRLKATPSSDGRVRSKTIAPKRLTRDERRLSALLVYPDDVERPRSREECANMPRP